MDKDSTGQRKMEDSGGGLLPAVGGHSLEQNRINNSCSSGSGSGGGGGGGGGSSSCSSPSSSSPSCLLVACFLNVPATCQCI